MTISVIDMAQAMDEIESMIGDLPDLQGMNLTVERSEPINEDTSQCPWIGLYKMHNALPVRTLGAGAGSRQQRARIAIMLQEADNESGEQCEVRLEKLVKIVLDGLLTRGLPSFDFIDDVEVIYDNYGMVGSAYLQQATLQFVGICNVSGG